MPESPPPLEPSVVGTTFMRQYYQLLAKEPQSLHRFYKDESRWCHGQGSQMETPIAGQRAINEQILKRGYAGARVDLDPGSIDCQASLGHGVVVLVTGVMTLPSAPTPRPFVQTFFLAVQPKGYFVLNDCLRFLELPAATGAADKPKSEPAATALPTPKPKPASAPVAAAAAVPAPVSAASPVKQPSSPVKSKPPSSPVKAEPPSSPVKKPSSPVKQPTKLPETAAAEPAGSPPAASPKKKPAPASPAKDKPAAAEPAAPKTWAALFSGKSAAPTPAAPTPTPAAPSAEPKAGEPKAGEPKAGEPKAGEPKAGEPSKERPRYFSLFIRDMPAQAKESELRELFVGFGTVAGVNIVSGRGYAFVDFVEQEAMRAALADPREFKLLDRTLQVEERSDRKEGQRGFRSDTRGGRGGRGGRGFSGRSGERKDREDAKKPAAGAAGGRGDRRERGARRGGRLADGPGGRGE